MKELYIWAALFGVLMGITGSIRLRLTAKYPEIEIKGKKIKTEFWMRLIETILLAAFYGWFVSPLRYKYIDSFGKLWPVIGVALAAYLVVMLLVGRVFPMKEEKTDEAEEDSNDGLE